MAVDGEKMRSNVEGMMAGFMKEKENSQNEMALLKRDREEKLALMDELRRDKIAVDIDSKNLQQNVSDLEMKLRGAEKFIADLENKVKSLKGEKRQNAPEQAITEIVNVNQLRDDKASLQNQLDSKEKSMIDLRQTNRDVSMKLSKAQQTIHKLQSKEKYLESRVESLSNQISQTVHDYEMKLVNCERR
jgi:multidrug resistance efflux pump